MPRQPNRNITSYTTLAKKAAESVKRKKPKDKSQRPRTKVKLHVEMS